MNRFNGILDYVKSLVLWKKEIIIKKFNKIKIKNNNLINKIKKTDI